MEPRGLPNVETGSAAGQCPAARRNPESQRVSLIRLTNWRSPAAPLTPTSIHHDRCAAPTGAAPVSRQTRRLLRAETRTVYTDDCNTRLAPYRNWRARSKSLMHEVLHRRRESKTQSTRQSAETSD